MTQHEVWEDVDKDPAAAADSYLPSPGFRILPHQAQGATVQGSSTSTARLASGSSSALSNRSSARQAYSAPVHTASQMDTSSADAASLMPYPPVGSGSKRSEPVSWGKDGLTTTTSSSSGSTRSSDSRSTQECRRSWPQRGSETKGYAGDGSISLTASILDESEEDEVELLAAARAASAANKALRAARDDAAEPPAAASLVAGREGPDDLGQNEEGRTRGMRMFLLMDSESADQT